ncbi:MAG: GPR endopeptidase [Lachnospiraceae bacterium]|nr:GPR endopeptidase [Agathobacter sp.]MDD6445758.1 GPR endopeptidase [Lachnospiraceae bacterium]MDY4893552.1 GPR endopeptidase [Agathobacter sp.]
MLEDGYPIRTDLALESQERLKKDQGNMRGIRVQEEKRENGVTVSTVVIETENAAKAMGRPKGTYITIEAPEIIEEDAGYHRDISMELAKILRKLLPLEKPVEDLNKGLEVSVLVVGLGNREVTPDALGPRVVDNLFITRHIMNEFGKYAFQSEDVSKISGIVPGVMAQTGMECVEILRGIVEETKPDFLITVDALAARSIKRLGRTIQLTDTGITPGSGIGNHRNAINKKSVGVQVISLGVPTVVDAATIVADAMSELVSALSLSDLQKLDERQRQELAQELLSPQLNGLFVTPKNIDDSIKQLSYLISEGLNIALLGNKEKMQNI